jgi:polyhydroxybutyrate depolymerase
MNKRIFFLFGALLFSAGISAPAASAQNNQYRSLQVNRLKRHYLVHFPRGHSRDRGLPLLLVLHGGSGTPRGMIKLTRGRFNEIADREGVWAVYPQGIRRHWNDHRKDAISYVHRNNVDDVAFIEALIESMKEEHGIDPTRVFATGISNGGFMCFRLATDLPGKIRAIAPVCASLPEDGLDAVENVDEVSLLLMNGTEDTLVPYHGGKITLFGKTRGSVSSTMETIRLWVRRLELGNDPKRTPLPDLDPEDGTRVHKVEYYLPANDLTVTHYRIEGGGHTWPGGLQYLREPMIGKTSRDINACDEIWRFFSGFE